MSRSPAAPRTTDEILFLLSAYDLGGVHRVAPAAGGATNEVYRVETRDGVLFLRIYRKREPAVAQREHALIKYVVAAGLPAPAPVPARDGSTVVQKGDRVMALYSAARGAQVPALDATRAHAAGDMLGRLHRALRPLPDAGYVRWSLSWNGPEWVERLLRIERAIAARAALDATDEWALRRVRAQRAWLADPSCGHAHSPRFACQVIHGDYQTANLFFESGQVSAVIDWEQGAYMPRAYELVRACAFAGLDAALTHAMLKGYAAHVALEPGELEDGARAWAVFSDHHVWPQEEVYLHGNDAARRYIPHVPFRAFEAAWSDVMAAA